MGLGSTAKKIQTLADRAEQLYVKLKEVHERVVSVEDTVDDTQVRVKELENAVEHQRVVIEALAEDRGIDVDAVVAEAAIEDVDDQSDDEAAAEASHTEATDGSTDDGTAATDGNSNA